MVREARAQYLPIVTRPMRPFDSKRVGAEARDAYGRTLRGDKEIEAVDGGVETVVDVATKLMKMLKRASE